MCKYYDEHWKKTRYKYIMLLSSAWRVPEMLNIDAVAFEICSSLKLASLSDFQSSFETPSEVHQ